MSSNPPSRYPSTDGTCAAYTCSSCGSLQGCTWCSGSCMIAIQAPCASATVCTEFYRISYLYLALIAGSICFLSLVWCSVRHIARHRGRRHATMRVDMLGCQKWDAKANVSASGSARGEGAYGCKECSVCLTDFENGTDVRVLRCKHVFHRDCIDHWLLGGVGKDTCPLCLTNVWGLKAAPTLVRTPTQEDRDSLQSGTLDSLARRAWLPQDELESVEMGATADTSEVTLTYDTPPPTAPPRRLSTDADTTS